MRLRLNGRHSSAFSALVAAVLFCGVALSVGLSTAPQLHEWLHQTNGTSHECSATLLSHGSWEHSAVEPILSEPERAPITRSFVAPEPRAIALAETSVLEHAPPANS
ncbi:MAG: hypothetical protein ABR526_00975 [Chthoniobacterales bacterium]